MDLSLPRGIRDIEPEEQSVHERIREAFYEVARLFDFKMMEPASIEHLSTLGAKSGEEVARQIYAFPDKSGREIGLRFDLTVGLTRYVASRRDLRLPAKLACFGGAWRYEEPQYGRYRWFHQWDIEVFGASGIEADAEVIEASERILRSVGLTEFVLQVGDRRVVEEYIRSALHVTSQEKLVEMMRALDKVQKKNEAELAAEYEAKGIKREDVVRLLHFGTLRGRPEKMMSLLDELHLKSTDSLKRVWESLRSRGVKDVEFNLSVVRGIDYYTAIVFEAMDQRNPQLGSLCGGGRYDVLPRAFGRPDLTATGAAGGIERMALSMSKEPDAVGGVFVAYAEEGLISHALRLVSELRNGGVAASMALEARGLSKQLQDASDTGARWAVIIGKKELASGEFTLKDMKTRREERLSKEELKRRVGAE